MICFDLSLELSLGDGLNEGRTTVTLDHFIKKVPLYFTPVYGVFITKPLEWIYDY